MDKNRFNLLINRLMTNRKKINYLLIKNKRYKRSKVISDDELNDSNKMQLLDKERISILDELTYYSYYVLLKNEFFKTRDKYKAKILFDGIVVLHKKYASFNHNIDIVFWTKLLKKKNPDFYFIYELLKILNFYPEYFNQYNKIINQILKKYGDDIFVQLFLKKLKSLYLKKDVKKMHDFFSDFEDIYYNISHIAASGKGFKEVVVKWAHELFGKRKNYDLVIFCLLYEKNYGVWNFMFDEIKHNITNQDLAKLLEKWKYNKTRANKLKKLRG